MSSILVSDLISGLFKSAGITPDDSLKAVLASKECSAQVPQEVANELQGALITVKEAKNHPKVRADLKGEFIGPFDVKIKRHLKELGIDEDEWREIRGDESRSIGEPGIIDSVLTKAFELGQKKGEKSGGKNVDEIRKQIHEEETAKVKAQLETHTKTITDLTEKLKLTSEEKKKIETVSAEDKRNLKRDFFISQQLSGLPFRKDLADSPETRQLLFNTVTEKALAEAAFVEDGKDYKLKNPKDNAADYLTSENKTLTPGELLRVIAAPFLDPNANKKADEGNGKAPYVPEPAKKDANPFKFSGPVKMGNF